MIPTRAVDSLLATAPSLSSARSHRIDFDILGKLRKCASLPRDIKFPRVSMRFSPSKVWDGVMLLSAWYPWKSTRNQNDASCQSYLNLSSLDIDALVNAVINVPSAC